MTTTPAPPVTDEGKVTDFLLFNGMEVAVIPDHRAGRHPYGLVQDRQRGMSRRGYLHVFEHLMLKAPHDEHGSVAGRD